MAYDAFDVANLADCAQQHASGLAYETRGLLSSPGTQNPISTRLPETMSRNGIRFIEPPSPDSRIVAAEVHGHVTADDVKAFVARIESVNARGLKARIFQDMREYHGADIAAFTEKFKHIGVLWKGIEKVAVVGDSRWLEIYIGVADPLTPQQIKYFPPDEAGLAFAWLREDPTGNLSG